MICGRTCGENGPCKDKVAGMRGVIVRVCVCVCACVFRSKVEKKKRLESTNLNMARMRPSCATSTISGTSVFAPKAWLAIMGERHGKEKGEGRREKGEGGK